MKKFFFMLLLSLTAVSPSMAGAPKKPKNKLLSFFGSFKEKKKNFFASLKNIHKNAKENWEYVKEKSKEITGDWPKTLSIPTTADTQKRDTTPKAETQKRVIKSTKKSSQNTEGVKKRLETILSAPSSTKGTTDTTLETSSNSSQVLATPSLADQDKKFKTTKMTFSLAGILMLIMSFSSYYYFFLKEKGVDKIKELDVNLKVEGKKNHFFQKLKLSKELSSEKR